jgi:transcriptional regulator GlxA family with amidase domain
MDAGLPPLTVSLLALPESSPAALYGLHEVFCAVGNVWSQLTGEAAPARRVAATVVSADGAPFVSALGVPIVPAASCGATPPPQVVLVADLNVPVDLDPRGGWPREARWVREQFERGATVCSVCSGSILLAESGLLDGLEATTHWSMVRLFREHYPRVRLRAERILSPTGLEHRIVTSGGAAAWEDLALYLVARYCGEAEAVRTAKIFLFGDRSEGQLPYAAMARHKRTEDALVAECQRWLAEHYAAPNVVARLVERSGLPERSLKRRFKAATGQSPLDYAQCLRIEEAKQMLETTALPTDEVGRHAGYEDPAFFRRLFRRRTGVTPARYRARFANLAGHRAPPPSPAPGCMIRPR